MYGFVPGGDIPVSQAQSAISVAATIAPSVASEAQSIVPSVVSSAITTVGSAVGAALPKNCSLGTKHFCVGFGDHIDCEDLPLNVSNILLRASTYQLSSLQAIDEALARITLTNVENCLILGLTFAILAFLAGIVFVVSMWSPQLCFVCQFSSFRIPMFGLIRVLCSLGCCVSLLVPSIFLQILLLRTKSLPLEMLVEKGPVSGQCLGALFCAAVMALVAIAFV